MLDENLLGPEKFHDMVRTILKEKKGSLLSGKEFIEYCKKASHEPLDWFVADWVDGDQKLDYAVTKVDPAKGTVEISKVGNSSFPVFVLVETLQGKWITQRIDRNKAVNELTFAANETIKGVVIPDGADVDASNNRWPKPSSPREEK